MENDLRKKIDTLFQSVTYSHQIAFSSREKSCRDREYIWAWSVGLVLQDLFVYVTSATYPKDIIFFY